MEAELARQCLGERWGKQAMRLLQLPGFGVVIAMIVLLAIGDIHRFENAKELVGFSGLGADVYDSGEEHSRKPITKEGRKELRWAMVEAAWRKRLTYKQLAKYALMKLGVENEITRFVHRKVPRRIAPREEVLTRLKELGIPIYAKRRKHVPADEVLLSLLPM